MCQIITLACENVENHITSLQRISKQNTSWTLWETSRFLSADLLGLLHSKQATRKNHKTSNKQFHFWVTGLLQVIIKPSCIIQRCHWWAQVKTDSPKETSRTRLWNRTKQCHLVREKQGKILAGTTGQHLILSLYLHSN